ncbi:MAG: sigma-70 family RNA polymerase sigma factor [Ignavibacteriae bacterium]|nr:sigma-70 family RNA polymerase sigma factor [Ignavibacteriota bacterium]
MAEIELVRGYRNYTDEELILKFQSEDVQAFNEIVRRYKNKAVNFLYRYTGDREEAEDLAQDTFIKVFRSKHLYKEIAKFSTWFYTIAVNTAKTNSKKRGRMSTISLSSFDTENEKDFDLTADIQTPEEDANSSIENEYIQRAINSLDEAFKQIIIMRDIEDLDYDEIAQALELPLGTVKSRINRGREKLKKILSEIYPYKEQ